MMAWIEAETINHCKLLMVLLDGVFSKCIVLPRAGKKKGGGEENSTYNYLAL